MAQTYFAGAGDFAMTGPIVEAGVGGLVPATLSSAVVVFYQKKPTRMVHAEATVFSGVSIYTLL